MQIIRMDFMLVVGLCQPFPTCIFLFLVHLNVNLCLATMGVYILGARFLNLLIPLLEQIDQINLSGTKNKH
jgi:hypothetical protein